MVKLVVFLGDSLARLRAFPVDVRRAAGLQIDRVQHGRDPNDWKPMSGIGPGVREIRLRERSGAYRLMYVAGTPDGIVVLHVFEKKTQATAKRDIELASNRLRL